jgi:transcriptional regulator with XRE-family HTH domain
MDISSEQIGAARELANMPQLELARRIGVSPGSMCTYERGLTPPKHRMAAIIAVFKALGIDFICEPGCEGVLKRKSGAV